MSENSHIRVRASIVIIQDGKILMTPHFLDDGSIKWHMPGGGVDFGEASREGAERELLEETGYIGKAGDVIAVHDVIDPTRDYHGIAITFLGEITGGEMRGEEHPIYGLKKPEWFTKDDLQGKIYDKPEIINQLLGIDP